MMHEQPPPPPGSASKEYPPGPGLVPEERQRIEHAPTPSQKQSLPPPPMNEPERAARTMDVDDDYDDDEDKKNVIAGPSSVSGSNSGEAKNATPTSATINNMIGPANKAETS